MAWHTWGDTEIEILPLVQPDLGQSGVVPVDDVRGASGKGIRSRFAKHVAHVRTRGYQNGATASPDLFGQGEKRKRDRLAEKR